MSHEPLHFVLDLLDSRRLSYRICLSRLATLQRSQMGNLQSLEREGSLTKAELDRLERRLKKLGRGRAEVARSDLKTLDGLGQNNFVERIFQMFDEGENQCEN